MTTLKDRLDDLAKEQIIDLLIELASFRIQYKILESENVILIYKISRRNETTY